MMINNCFVMIITYNYDDNKIYIFKCCKNPYIRKSYDIDYFLNNFNTIFEDFKTDKYFLSECENCKNKIPGRQDIDYVMVQNKVFINCNLNCNFCCEYRHHTYENKVKLADKDVKNYLPTTSGEPFMNRFFKDYFLFNLHTSGIKSSMIITNASVIDKSYIMKLIDYTKKYDIHITFVMSICSYDKSILEKEEKGAKFEKIIENAVLLSSNFNCIVSVLQSDFNINDDFENQVSKFLELGVKANYFQFEKDVLNNSKILDEKYKEFMKKYHQAYVPLAELHLN